MRRRQAYWWEAREVGEGMRGHWNMVFGTWVFRGLVTDPMTLTGLRRRQAYRWEWQRGERKELSYWIRFFSSSENIKLLLKSIYKKETREAREVGEGMRGHWASPLSSLSASGLPTAARCSPSSGCYNNLLCCHKISKLASNIYWKYPWTL